MTIRHIGDVETHTASYRQENARLGHVCEGLKKQLEDSRSGTARVTKGQLVNMQEMQTNHQTVTQELATAKMEILELKCKAELQGAKIPDEILKVQAERDEFGVMSKALKQRSIDAEERHKKQVQTCEDS